MIMPKQTHGSNQVVFRQGCKLHVLAFRLMGFLVVKELMGFGLNQIQNQFSSI